MTTMNATPASAALTVRTARYNYAFGYLRTFIVLVVAHHAALAYHPFG